MLRNVWENPHPFPLALWIIASDHLSIADTTTKAVQSFVLRFFLVSATRGALGQPLIDRRRHCLDRIGVASRIPDETKANMTYLLEIVVIDNDDRAEN